MAESKKTERSFWAVGAAFPLICLAACTGIHVCGTPASLAWSAGGTSYTFPSTAVNNTSTATLTAINLGETTASRLLMAPSSPFSFVGGVFPGTGGTCGTSLAAFGTVCTIVLSYSPTVGGTSTAVLGMDYFDGEANRSLSINVQGSAVPEGTLDSTFGTGGLVSIDFGYAEQVRQIALQSDGKIVAVGDSNDGATGDENFNVLRLTSAGALDALFGTGGKVSTDILSNSQDFGHALSLASTGQITVAGASGTHAAMAQYLANGTLNSSFGTTGTSLQPSFQTSSTDVAYAQYLQSDGKFIMVGESAPVTGGSSFFAVRTTSGGAVDAGSTPDFGIAGIQTVHFGGATQRGGAYAIGVMGNGDYILGGYTQPSKNDSALAMINGSTGVLDVSFFSTGTRSLDICGFGEDDQIQALAVQSDQKIVVTGYCAHNASAPLNKDIFVARFNSDGTLDTAFNAGGSVPGVIAIDVAGADDEGKAVSVTSAGQIFVAGYATVGGLQKLAVAEIRSDGTLNTAFGTGGIVTTALGSGNSQALSMAIQSDGKIVLGGFSTGTTQDFAFARYFP